MVMSGVCGGRREEIVINFHCCKNYDAKVEIFFHIRKIFLVGDADHHEASLFHWVDSQIFRCFDLIFLTKNLEMEIFCINFAMLNKK